MSKLNQRKKSKPFGDGIIAGKKTNKAGKYTNEQLLRRVVMCNLLWESTYYQSADEIMQQIDSLTPKVSPEFLADLAIEVRFEQKLRHTPIYLALCLLRDHSAGSLCRKVLGKICTRVDMCMDTLAMLPKVLEGVRGKGAAIRPIPHAVKKGLADAFAKYDYYQISKYKKASHEISLVDVVNIVHPVPNEMNAEALRDLVNNKLKPPQTWETKLSAGEDKAQTFTDLIKAGKLGAMATFRNMRNMIESGVDRKVIIEGIDNVNSRMLTPLDFLKASLYGPQYIKHINRAMKRCFVDYQIPGTTIVALDVSGSMGGFTSHKSTFSRLDLGYALMALACYIFEDPILVYTAGNDSSRIGKHMIAPSMSGLEVFNDAAAVRREVGGGGIFTRQLCEWLKDKGLAKDADRLVVISDSQDIDAARGDVRKPDTSPYDTSYIIDISHHTHGIKVGGVWTAEIGGWSDKLFHYILAAEGFNQSQ